MPDQPPAPLPYATPLPRPRRWIVLWVVVGCVILLFGWASLLMYVNVRRAVAAQTAARAAMQAALQAAPGRAIVAPAATSRLTVVQRTSATLPGTNDTILARIGDITGGQVLLGVHDANGQELVPSTSVRQGDVQRFTVNAATFEIELLELRNLLTGDDFAVFEIRRADATTAPALSEAATIERLLEIVAKAEGVTFIRNGDKHSAADAADHLRRKYNAARDRHLTAQQFIEHVASRSSITGREYRVRLPGGREMTSSQWLIQCLREIESTPFPTRKGK